MKIKYQIPNKKHFMWFNLGGLSIAHTAQFIQYLEKFNYTWEYITQTNDKK